MTARVIPPLAAISPGVLEVDGSPADALFVVTSAQFTASTLPETPPALWSGATNYALGGTASIAAAGNARDVYESLQNGNLNHAPGSSPTWWKLLGRTYGVFAVGSYAVGDRVINLATHLEYESLVAANNAQLSDSSKWLLLGPTNKWRAVDVLRNTKATGPSGTSFTFVPGKRIDAIGLAGMVADSFTISLKVGGVEKWSHSESLSTRNTLTWSDYFFGAFLFRSTTAIFGVPKYAGAEITITFFRSPGDISVGAIWINEAVALGKLQTEPGIDRRNFSDIGNKPTGETILIRRRSIPETSWVTLLRKDRLPKVKPLPDELNAVPAMWVGIPNSADEYFDLVTLVAVYTRFTITPGQAGVRIDLGLKET